MEKKKEKICKQEWEVTDDLALKSSDGEIWIRKEDLVLDSMFDVPNLNKW